MRIKVLDATIDKDMWDEALAAFPPAVQDIYLTPKYYQMHQHNGDGLGRLFTAEEDGNRLIYPFLIKDIPPIGNTGQSALWKDIETAYGYGGPIATTTQPKFLSRCWDSFHDWCNHNRVVSEFIRFNPLINSQRFAGKSCNIMLDRETVAINLDVSSEELWNKYPSGQRNKVQRAQNSGLVCQEAETAKGLDRFRKLYIETMRRVDAGGYYEFSDAYFSYLFSEISDNVKLFEVTKNQKLAASGLFLTYGDRLHYHFGASNNDQWQARPNNLLFHTVALWGIEHGYRNMHLGGGRTPDENDGLLQFKSSLSKTRLPFHLGTRVHNQLAYDSLCSTWQRQSKQGNKPNYFQLYRLPISGHGSQG